MHRRQALHALSLIAIAWPAMTAALAAHGMSEQPVDLMPSFWRAYDASRQASAADRIVALASGFFLPQAAHYSAAGFNGAGMHGRLLDSRITAWLDRLDQIAASVRVISATLPTAWDQHRARFTAANLQMPADAGGCFLPSLFSFTGYSRVWHAQPMLFIAPDGVVAQLGPAANLAVLLDHEAFHVYQDGTAPALLGPLLWERLGREGLATFASGKLNPSATLDQVLMSSELPNVSRSTLAAAARSVSAGLDGDQLIASLFDIGRGAGLPDRMGYLLGFRAVQEVIGSRSLCEAAQLPAAQARSALETGLVSLARQL